jgi:double-stranded uracil-DNA glycosylase
MELMKKPYQDSQSVCLRGLAPLADVRTRVVVLGSFPSEASLAKQQYYGHPRNHFWFLLSCVLNEPLVQWPYALRCERLLARGIGIWDTVSACEREGSLDSAIEGAQPNDPNDLLAIAPQLAHACFNGGFSQSLADAWAAHGLQTQALPSSSPANATHRFDVKLAAWKAALTKT